MQKSCVYKFGMFIVVALTLSVGAVRADERGTALPAVRKGQPTWSFSGGKRISSQEANPTGMQEYSGSGHAGTGIQEIGAGGVSDAGANVATPANNPVKQIPSKMPSAASNYAGTKFLTGSKNGQVVAPKPETKKGTTVVQLLGPDGKMQYKEVPFYGELSANKRAPNITNIKDGEGKVKEYDWVKKKP